MRSWLYGIVKNRASDYRRKTRTRNRIVVQVDVDAAYAVLVELSPEERLLSQETLALIERVKLEPRSLHGWGSP